MRIVATRRLPGPAWDELPEVVVGPAEGDAEILIVTNEPVELERFPSLRLIANYGVGYDRIDVEAARARGVAVTNTPGSSTPRRRTSPSRSSSQRGGGSSRATGSSATAAGRHRGRAALFSAGR